jgi:hypothetical protein
VLWLMLLLCVHFFSAVCIVVVAEFTPVFFFSFFAHSLSSVVYPSAYNSSSHEQYRHRGNFLSFFPSPFLSRNMVLFLVLYKAFILVSISLAFF